MGGAECPRCRPPEQGGQGSLEGPRACWAQFRKHASLDEAAHPALNLFSRTDSGVDGGHGEALGAPTTRCLGSEGVCLGQVLPTWPRPEGTREQQAGPDCRAPMEGLGLPGEASLGKGPDEAGPDLGRGDGPAGGLVALLGAV